jgi:exosortase
MAEKPTADAPSSDQSDNLLIGGLLAVLTVLLVWGYWGSLIEASVYWRGAQYSHGFLIPLFTVGLLWLRRSEDEYAELLPTGQREQFTMIGSLVLLTVAAAAYGIAKPGPTAKPGLVGDVVLPLAFAGAVLVSGLGAIYSWLEQRKPEPIPMVQRWWGIGLLVFGLVCWLGFTRVGLDIPGMYTIVFSLGGLLLLVGGWAMFRFAGPAVAFLLFMFPLPWRVEQNLLVPLQTFATQASTYLLQTMGIEAYRDGNRICIEELQLGVIDQCAGLRMTTIFLALCVAVVLLLRRTWWENLIILLSAIPIALAVNIVRVTATGIAHLTVGADVGEGIHKWAGWIMMPLALLLLWLEVTLMSRLYYEVDEEAQVAAMLGGRQRR